MPLQIKTGTQEAKNVFIKGRDITGRRKGNIAMGGFLVANNTSFTTALSTTGAGPCQIIVVHKTRGHGALGHYSGPEEPEKILAGVKLMVQHLGGAPIENIVFAAGIIGNDDAKQSAYETSILDKVRAFYPTTQVEWPPYPAEEAWGTCYYLPLEELVAFVLDGKYSGDFQGTGDREAGISRVGYGDGQESN